MNRNILIYSAILFSMLSCGRPNMAYNQQGVEMKSEPYELKQRIDSAVMKTYRDADYHVEISYPDFFAVCDTTEDGTARFYYPSNQEQRIALKMFVEPNVEGWNIHEAIKNLSNSNNVCQEEGEDYYIMSGQLDQDPRARFFEKCYLINGMWINYTVYYLAEDKDAIGRLIDTVKEWNPRASMLRVW